mgnify:CR=1 FL=1
MSSLRVLSIIGTRPEAVKMAPVVQALSQNKNIESRVCVTAQHREMLDQVLKLFNIHPQQDLNLMRPDQSLADLTAGILSSLDPVLEHEKPDWVLVQGDTTTVMAASLAAFYRGISVGHVEAGLRTGDKQQPFPEEINRRLTSVIADLHFAPTERSRENLLREGIPASRIRVTGNTVIDALQQIVKTETPPNVRAWLEEWGVRQGGRRLVLLTAHRRENFGEPIKHICEAVQSLAERYGSSLRIVYPVHPNPNIQSVVHRMLEGVPAVTLIQPVDYITLIHLIKHSTLVLTDSGGIQEEASGLGKPALVLREVTERPEGVDAGVLKLVGTDPQKIVREAAHLLDDSDALAEMARVTNLYGDGKAAGRIVEAILNFPPAVR